MREMDVLNVPFVFDIYHLVKKEKIAERSQLPLQQTQGGEQEAGGSIWFEVALKGSR